MQFQGIEAQHKQPCVVIWRNQVCDVDFFGEKENLYKNCYSTFHVVGVVPMSITTMPLVMHVLLVFTKICEHKISGSKHINGSKVWGFVALSVQLPPTWLVRGDVVLLRAAR